MPDELTRPDAPHAIQADATSQAIDAVTQAGQDTGVALADLPRNLVGIMDNWVKGPNIGFQIGTGAKCFFCGITRDALLDLAGYHGLRDNEENLFRCLWPIIERLLREKHRAGRGGHGEDMLITSADLLLYGFDATRSPRPVATYRGRDLAGAGPLVSRLARLLSMLEGQLRTR